VDWGEEQTAYLIVGIAAQDNEHLDILRQLTHALSDERVPEALSRAESPQAVLEILAGNIFPAEEMEPPPAFDEEATLPCAIPTDCTRGQARYW
jgi:phosphocarrier protein